MPAIRPGAKVLVSGANGFVAVWIIQNLLQKGYSVRGTIRAADKAVHLDNLFKQKYPGKWEWIVVPDITKTDAFDEAVKGVDGIIHTASPADISITSPEACIRPAVEGTLSILKSAKEFGTGVKRVVYLSSVAAIIEIGDLSVQRTLTEADWNNQAPALVEAKGSVVGPMVIYCASKSLAEKAAWDFRKDSQDKVSWDLVTLLPPMIYGPVIHEVNSPESLNETTGSWYKALLAPEPHMAEERFAQGFVDVRDVATAHVLALETEAAGGERFIISRDVSAFQDWRDIIQDIVVPRVQGTLPADRLATLPKGVYGAGKKIPRSFILDASKAERVFGIKYRNMEETAEDTVKDYLVRGW